MKLMTLRLRNFQGVEDFELKAGGADISVFGDNGTGKTTLANACSWLLFGKDSKGNAQFDLKPLDELNQPRHNLETSVEATFELGGGELLELRKVFYEKWAKKRGGREKEFDGHTTDHFVNGVPVQAKDYLAQVAQIAEPEQFRLLTDPLYFAEGMHWQKRRALLLEVCGDITDADVIAREEELADLLAILGKRSVDDHRKVVTSRRKEVNEQLDKIPVRLDEVQRGKTDTEGDLGADKRAAEALRTEIQQLEREELRVENGGQVAELDKQLAEAEAAKSRRQNVLREVARNSVGDLRSAADKRLQDANNHLHQVRMDLSKKEDLRTDLDRQLRRAESRRAELVAEWQMLQAQKWEGEKACPTCKQELPADQVQAAEAAFNQQKAEKLEVNQAAGKEIKAEMDRCTRDLAHLEPVLTQLNEAKEAAVQASEEARRALAEIKIPEPDFVADAECQELELRITELSGKIAESRSGLQDRVEIVRHEREAKQESLRIIQARIQTHANQQLAQKRTAELEAEQKRLAAEFDELERQLDLLDQFTRTKVSLLTEHINDHFQLAQFKLFKEQINGGLQECCEVTCGGVPYSTGLNNGSRINVGLDIIRTLGNHFGTTAPVFADNAEAVTHLLEIPAQVVRLVVSESDPQLRVSEATGEQLQLKEVAA